jgi:hypothetical protein
LLAATKKIVEAGKSSRGDRKFFLRVHDLVNRRLLSNAALRATGRLIGGSRDRV